MKILVDADSCPASVRTVICRASKRTKTHVIFAANRNIAGLTAELTRLELCPQGEGKADDRIVELAEEGDLAISRDVPLAKRLVDLKVHVMDDRGRIFTSDNIRTMMSLRDFNVGLANNGCDFVRTANYTQKDLKKFSDSFNKLLTLALQKSVP